MTDPAPASTAPAPRPGTAPPRPRGYSVFAIAREAMRRGTSMAGLTFFAHGGAQAGSRFRGFCGVLEQIAGRNPPSAVDGAITGFTFFMNALLDHGSQATHTGSAGAVACG